LTGSTQQWQQALGTPLSKQAATAASPFITYSLPAQTPAALQPSGTSLLLPQALVYDPTAEGSRPPSGMRPTPAPGAASTTTPTKAAQPFPVNPGTRLTANCSSPLLQQRRVYTQQQVQTAYGIDTLRAHTSGTPVITVLDLGGGWLPNDLKLAGQCFGYSPPSITQTQGDGVATSIAHADDETSPADRGGGGPRGTGTVGTNHPRRSPPRVQPGAGGQRRRPRRHLAVLRWLRVRREPGPARLHLGDQRRPGDDGAGRRLLVRGGGRLRIDHLWDQRARDHAVLPGGVSLRHRGRRHPPHTRPGNTRIAEVVWNDSVFGVSGAGGGAVARLQPRPAYQDGANAQNHRALPDISALSDIVPGWPDVINSTLQTVGGTSGSTPFVAAATALVAASERKAGRPPVGLANGWFYKAAAQPSTFFDVTQGNNDLEGVGCCQATIGYDPASGLGVPNWTALPATLPKPG
jgi:hypothetical protein